MSLKTYTERLMVKDRIQYTYNDSIRIEFDRDYLSINGNAFPTGLAGMGQTLTASTAFTGVLEWATPAPQGATGVGIMSRYSVLTQAQYPPHPIYKETYVASVIDNWSPSTNKNFGFTGNGMYPQNAGTYRVSYQVNYTPEQIGDNDFILRLNGVTGLSDSYADITSQAAPYSIYQAVGESITDLQAGDFLELTTTQYSGVTGVIGINGAHIHAFSIS
jgi:hypothetical protein